MSINVIHAGKYNDLAFPMPTHFFVFTWSGHNSQISQLRHQDITGVLRPLQKPLRAWHEKIPYSEILFDLCRSHRRQNAKIQQGMINLQAVWLIIVY